MGGGGGGRKGTLGSCQQGSMAKLLYATLVLFQIENVVIFFHPQSDTTYRLILDFTNPTMILSIMLHRLLIPK